MIRLRATPASLSNEEVSEMLKKYNFYCKRYSWDEEYANSKGEFKNDFVDNIDGTVTDNATGLMWQKAEAPDYGPWEMAQVYIHKLNKICFAGHSDWRLPTIEELASLVTSEPLNDGLYVGTVFTNKMWFWSCDKGSGDAGRNWSGSTFVWAINFKYGTPFCLETTNGQNIRAVRTVSAPAKKKSNNHKIALRSRPKDFTGSGLGEIQGIIKKYNFFCKAYEWNKAYCNEAGTSQNDFTDNADGTCVDWATGLMWQKKHRPNYGKWDEALQYIKQLNKEHFAGYSDWRLPTVEECLSLFTNHKGDNGLYINPLFSNRMWIWTSDTKDNATGQIWNANFLYGSIFWLESDNGQDIRAVRSI